MIKGTVTRHARRNPGRCPHGRHNACFTRHRPDGPALGQPLCPDCYDYAAHVVWNNNAGELWRRTKQAIERRLGQLARRRGISPIWVPCGDGRYRPVDPVRVAHGKAAEYQARGAVHFHALLRLDGYDPAEPDKLIPPPPGFTIADLDEEFTNRWREELLNRTWNCWHLKLIRVVHVTPHGEQQWIIGSAFLKSLGDEELSALLT